MHPLAKFQFAAPRTWDELWCLYNQESAFLAGGTDLLIDLRTGKKQANQVIDIKQLPGMKEITIQKDSLWIGALCTASQIEQSPIIRRESLALAKGAGELGSWQIRNRATIGGNLCNGSPTADMSSSILALDALLHYQSPHGAGHIKACDFWQGPLKTTLPTGAVLYAVQIPLHAKRLSTYYKLGMREAMEIAVVSAAVVLEMNDELVERAGIAISGGGKIPLLSPAACTYLRGKTLAQICPGEAGKLAVGDTNPRSSSRASREYRLQTIQVIVERALQELII